MDFQTAVQYLYSLGNEVQAMKLGLEATEKLLRALGNPERKFTKIQIAGTNGKGSTAAFLDAMCRDARIATGLFTSPHLISITERIKINGAELSEEKFAAHATRIRAASEDLVKKGALAAVPTFFEQTTAIAVSAFAEAGVRLAILETGLGGRFDSVTATGAEIAVIAPIDFDHQQILGDTLAEISAEKAAIVRENTRRVVVAPQKPEAEKIIGEVCLWRAVAPVWATPKIELLENLDDGRARLFFRTGRADYRAVLSLRGRHQQTNAALAIRAAEILADEMFEIRGANVERGLETAEHAGRLELWRRSGAAAILFDGAHNIAGANALKDYLDERITQPITLIFGAMRDKDLTEIARALFPLAARLILTAPDNPRSFAAKDLIEFVPADFDAKKVFQTANVAEALNLADEISGADDLICVTGSLYLVGEVQKLLNNKSEN